MGERPCGCLDISATGHNVDNCAGRDASKVNTAVHPFATHHHTAQLLHQYNPRATMSSAPTVPNVRMPKECVTIRFPLADAEESYQLLELPPEILKVVEGGEVVP